MPLGQVAPSADFKGKCSALRKALFPEPEEGSTIPPLKSPTADLTSETHPITAGEITRAIGTCNLSSAPGHDTFPYTVINHLHKANPALLTGLYNASIMQSYYPKQWKHANCVVIPKGGKRDPSAPSSYRPISLLSNVGKILEKIMARRLSAAAIACGAITSSQFGAIEGRSATDALSAIIHHSALLLTTPRNSANTSPPRPSFLTNDIAGAFNNTDPKRLRVIMEKRGIPSYITEWTASFTKGRTMSFNFDNQTESPQPFNSGLPQGSPTSPVLFLVYAQAMMEAPPHPREHNVSYLDDDALLQVSPTLTGATKRLEERVASRVERGEQLNLPYDFSKSGLMHLHPRTAPTSRNLPLHLPHTTIQASVSIRHLGVQLDQTLSFQSHMQNVVAKGMQTLGCLHRLQHQSTSLSFKVRRHLVTTILLPQMLWASPAYWT